MDFYSLEMSFPIEWQSPLWQLKPSYFLSRLINHEGPGSLYSYLKNKHWITGLSAGTRSLGRGMDVFRINISMTEDGFSAYKYRTPVDLN
jgi:insulysin